MNLIPTLILALASRPQGSAAPVSLGRVFHPNEKLSYAVRSSIHAERRGSGLETWLPEDLDINYDFSILVESLKADGIAVLRYQRPWVDEVTGETFDAPPKTKRNKTNYDFRLTVSPFNEILDMKDLTPKKKPAKKTTKVFVIDGTAPQVSVQGFVGQFISELYRLCLFTGNMESALDFAPRMTFDDVKVGDTWKRTVGYQPQKLKGKDGKQAVQRLDYTYTYKGLVNGEKGKVHRVEAKLSFDTDVAEFVKQLTEASAEDLGLEKLPLKLDATIVFDLDPKTKNTLRADAVSDGSFQIFAPGVTGAAFEERMKGHTTLRLVKSEMVKVTKK